MYSFGNIKIMESFTDFRYLHGWDRKKIDYF